jgi:predicted NAD/FAD-binding protein
MKIAIIGSGIAGNTIGHLLHKEHDISIFESNNRVGGHSHTHRISLEHNQDISVDTGFIVFNKKTYPLFTNLLDELNIDYEDSDMSFSVFSKLSGLEYNGTNLNTLFAQRKNIFSPRFIKMVFEILRFNKDSLKVLNSESEFTLGEYLDQENHSKFFSDHYILPMGAAIWSSDIKTMLNFPAKFFVSFFNNHGMLSVNKRPQWLTITGGSENYVEKLCRPFRNKIQLNSKIKSIDRTKHGVRINHHSSEEFFDYVFFACHSDQALKLLSDASAQEKNVLEALPYVSNDVLLHTDPSFMPKNKLAWAAWNYNIDKKPDDPITLTYNMNILQNLKTKQPILVTLNPNKPIHKEKILKRLNYSHPKFSMQGIEAQKQHNVISGINYTGYAGAYWGNGFHEDGVRSAYNAIKHFKDFIQ